jgi:hypothetical protein
VRFAGILLCGDSEHRSQLNLRHFASLGLQGPNGEIGRHSGLKIRRHPEMERTGSIPVSGTNI